MPFNPYSEESRRVPVRCLDCGYEWETRADYPRCSDPNTTEISCGKSRQWEYQNPGDVPVSQIGSTVDPARNERGPIDGETDNDTPLRDSEFADEYEVDFVPDGEDSDDDDDADESGESEPETPEENDDEESAEIDGETDQDQEGKQVLQIDVENDTEEPDMESAELEISDDDQSDQSADEPEDDDEPMVTPQEYDAFHGHDPEDDEGDSSGEELDTLTGASDAPMGLPVSRDTLIKVGVILAVVVVGYIVYTKRIKSSESPDGDNPEPTFEDSNDGGERVESTDADGGAAEPNDPYESRDEGEIPLFE